MSEECENFWGSEREGTKVNCTNKGLYFDYDMKLCAKCWEMDNANARTLREQIAVEIEALRSQVRKLPISHSEAVLAESIYARCAWYIREWVK